MIKIPSRVYIARPSYFKLKLNSIVTAQGDSVDLNEVSLIFDFYDKVNNCYRAIYDCKGNKSVNVIPDLENDSLTIIFQNYNLQQGQLSAQIATVTDDDDFEDDEWKFSSTREMINIILV